MLNLIVTWRELKSRDKLRKESRIHRRESKLICIILDLNHFTMSLYRQQTEKESYSLISVPKLIFCFVLCCYRRQFSYLLMYKNKKKNKEIKGCKRDPINNSEDIHLFLKAVQKKAIVYQCFEQKNL